MAWTAQNLFVVADPREPLLAALARLFEDPAHRADGDGLVPDAPPPLTIGPAADGWIPVLGLRGWVTDQPAFARELSGADGVDRVVSSEVLGACYRLRHGDYRRGEQLHAEQIPEEGWGQLDGEPDEAPGPMPLYRDVEQLAYALLLDLGIAPTVALIGTQPPIGGEEVELGEATALCWADGQLERRAQQLRATSYDEGPEVPVLPRQVGRDFGLHFLDDRFVEGAPSAASVNRLLQLEEKILDRARRLYGAELTLTMSYYNGGYQDELDALLIARDRQVPARTRRPPRVPWWQFWRYFGRLK